MSTKKSMKEWGVSNELELLREIVLSSPYLQDAVRSKLRVLKERASENLFQEASRVISAKEAGKKRAKGEYD